jgi:hypothetical protein
MRQHTCRLDDEQSDATVAEIGLAAAEDAAACDAA